MLQLWQKCPADWCGYMWRPQPSWQHHQDLCWGREVLRSGHSHALYLHPTHAHTEAGLRRGNRDSVDIIHRHHSTPEHLWQNSRKWMQNIALCPSCRILPRTEKYQDLLLLNWFVRLPTFSKFQKSPSLYLQMQLRFTDWDHHQRCYAYNYRGSLQGWVCLWIWCRKVQKMWRQVCWLANRLQLWQSHSGIP